MRERRVVVAWIEVAFAIVVTLVLLGIGLARQTTRSQGGLFLSVLFTVVLLSPLLIISGQRLYRALSGEEERRPHPPTARGMVGLVIVVLAVLAAIAPALIQL